MFPTLLLSGILLMPGSGSGKVSPATFTAKAPTTITNQSVSPTTITFSATNPNGTPVVGGSSAAVVSWTADGAAKGAAWSLDVSAPANFSSCPTVPVSAVTVACTSATGGATSACGGSSALSVSKVQMAGGTENKNGNYSVTLSFTLQDSWKYIASSSCSLSLTYTITAN